jgi:hypothetical protein
VPPWKKKIELVCRIQFVAIGREREREKEERERERERREREERERERQYQTVAGMVDRGRYCMFYTEGGGNESEANICR